MYVSGETSSPETDDQTTDYCFKVGHVTSTQSILPQSSVIDWGSYRKDVSLSKCEKKTQHSHLGCIKVLFLKLRFFLCACSLSHTFKFRLRWVDLNKTYIFGSSIELSEPTKSILTSDIYWHEHGSFIWFIFTVNDPEPRPKSEHEYIFA